MKYYLILQYPYEHIEIALCSKGKVEHTIQENKVQAVKLTIPHIDNLLKKQNVSLQDLSCIAVNTGPGPYNTLRALITTVNGIHFVTKTPLISASALDLLLAKQTQPSLAILNAFAKHVFYAFKTSYSNEHGYCSIEDLIQKINSQKESLTLLGNGAKMYQQQLLAETKNIIFPQEAPLFSSIESLAEYTYNQLQQKQTEPSYLMPRYLQSPAIK
ncbi:MAG: tRNA (adenosine(37)-N6)-threonylcarbamoyltransferase complex dimerization subunit type 1 TsaB [Epsilonproteobacteria bacterium]|nr:tRNA (adenosine(37)-N6)-threonylcarbamoyltransferase complex dimerization subunit type 1 TsaB [Campylobacterota bacterium]|tara:strand:+ start:387 stop:1031 length:645 start_codon:yes stop_codon:yes gene_type:complete